MKRAWNRIGKGVVVALLLVNLLLGTAVWRESARRALPDTSPAPPAPPHADLSDSGYRGPKPYRNDVSLEYWAFSPKRTWYVARGELTALVDGSVAVSPIRNPTYAGVATENVTVSPTARLLELNRKPHFQGYSSVGPVLQPAKPLRARDVFKYELSWTEARVPYLHDDRPPFYMLSIRIDPFPDEPHTEFHFAIPDTATQIATTDLQPAGSRRFPGWIVYDYVARKGLQSLIHITYNVSGDPRNPPPAADLVFGAAR